MGTSSLQGTLTQVENEVSALHRKCEQLEISIQDLLACPTIKNDNLGPGVRPREPEIITHEHFDPSISHWFSGLADTGELHMSPSKPENTREFDRVEAVSGIQPIHIHDYSFRLGGVSAFPLQPCGDRTLLGVRFDQFIASQGSFSKTYYLVLIEKESELEASETVNQSPCAHGDDSMRKPQRWRVYLHNLPDFVPISHIATALDSPESSTAVQKVAASIRDSLLLIRGLYESFDSLRHMSRDEFVPASAHVPLIHDIACDERELLFTISLNTLAQSSRHMISLRCNTHHFYDVSVDIAGSHPNACQALVEILSMSLVEDVLSTMTRVFTILAKMGLL